MERLPNLTKMRPLHGTLADPHEHAFAPLNTRSAPMSALHKRPFCSQPPARSSLRSASVSIDGTNGRRERREALRESIVRLTEAGERPRDRVPTGSRELDEALGGGLSRRGVHEWFALGDRERLRMPPMGVLIHAAWQALAQEALDRRRAAVWIGRACQPPASALMRGLRGVVNGRRPAPDPRLLERSIFIDATAPQERAWAIEQAARCPGVFVVVADGAGFDAALSRRVQLAAQGQSLVLLARPDRERDARSVAMTRWLVMPESSVVPASERIVPQASIAHGTHDAHRPLEWPPPPKWRVLLLRSKQAGASSSIQGTNGGQ